MCLTKTELGHFFSEGYLILKNVFTPSEVKEMSDAISELSDIAKRFSEPTKFQDSYFAVEGSGLNHKIKRVVWCGGVNKTLLNYGRSSKIRSIAKDILGTTKGDHLINQVHFKNPNDSVFFPWHQDSTHRRYGSDKWNDVNGKGSYVQIITAIDESTLDNGPLYVIPKSSRNGHLNLPYQDGVQTESDLFDPNDAIPGLLKPGDVIAFGPYLIHGSFPNTSNNSRRIFINGYAAPGANSRDYGSVGAGELVDLL